jgi:hypothetical protein
MSTRRKASWGGYFENTIFAALLFGKDVKRLRSVARCDDPVGHLAGDDFRGGKVAWRGQPDEVAERRHPICAARTGVGAGEGREGFLQVIDAVHFFFNVIKCNAHGCAGRRDVLERRRRGEAQSLLKFFHQGIRVERV